MAHPPSPSRVAARFLRADDADTGWGVMLEMKKELERAGYAVEYADQVNLLKRLRAGDRVEITWSKGSTYPDTKQVYEVSSDFDGDKVYLAAKRQSRSGGGMIMDYGPRSGLQWQPSMMTPVRRVLGLKKV